MASSARIDELRKKFDENPRRYFAPLANEYRKAGDLEQAVFICQEYLPQQPGHMSGHIVYGQTLFEMARNDEAQVVFETALSLDPENLIALRHLGDIARLTGDSNAARIWYQRVLEADPRNEEIAQLMISLLAAPEPTPVPPPTPVSTPTRVPTPLSMPAVPQRAPQTSAADESEGAGFVVEKSQDESQLRAAPVEVPSAEPPPPAHTTGAAKAIDGHDFLNLEDFNIGGVPSQAFPPAQSPTQSPAHAEPFSSQFSVPASNMDESTESSSEPADEEFEELSLAEAFRAPPPDARREPEPPVAPDLVVEEPAFELGKEDGPFEADHFAIAGSSGEPPVDLAADINLGLPSADAAVEEFSTTEEVPSIDGLQTFEPGVIGESPAEISAFETEAFFDTTPALSGDDTASEPERESEPESAPQSEQLPAMESPAFEESEPLEDLASAPAAPAFVTETMAELYLQQGHLDAALDIYRQLVDQRPDDMELAERLRAVEVQVFAVPATVHAEDESTSPVYGGPTIREFLLGLTSRRTPLVADAVPVDEPENQLDPRADFLPVFEDEGAFARTSEPPSELPRHSGSGETVRGSIDALFSGADASVSDANAASAFQEAFAPDGPETAPLQGMPAHRASSELSLDHVFKGNAPPRPDGDGFSFDQFFAEEMADSAPTASEANGPPSEVTDDIAQFNAWLNGLKKT